MSRWKTAITFLMLIAFAWFVASFGALAFGVHLSGSLLVKFFIGAFVLNSLVFILPVMFIEKYLPSNLVAVLTY